MTYTPSRERDAWFAIRGFVYQVELTIDRWIALAPDDCLELERGEDIDVVAGWVAGSARPDRLLEQIKHSDTPLTLNSREARSALANFVEHRSHNPSVRLRFRFVTTASVGKEASPKMPQQQRGIEVWERVRRGETDKTRCSA